MEAELSRINERTVLAQYGPMRLSIEAWGERGPDPDLAEEAGRFSFSLLPRLAPAASLFRLDLHPFDTLCCQYDDPLLNRMVEAVHKTGKKDLGPMATIAGLIAETVALWLREAGAVKAIVGNGGDLAIHLAPGQTARVGVRLGVQSDLPAYSLELSGTVRQFWGVASSGTGGRSLTQGIADAAMCVAANAVDADAAATAVAGACFVDSPSVRRVPAEALQPDTDIRGLLVTESVGELAREEIETALDAALCYAETLVSKGAILGALVALRGSLRLTSGFIKQAAPLLPEVNS